jgi:hypothetical protein
MSEAMTTRTLKDIFRFPFQGPNWQSRFLLGAALIFASSFIPLVPMVFVYGYILHVMRQAIKGEGLSMPAWDDWGKLGTDGLRAILIGLVYMLPGIIVFVGGMALYMGASFAFPLLMSGVQDESGLAIVLPMMFLGSMAIMFISMFLGSVLSVLGAIPLPAAAAHFVSQDKVGAAFRVREWWPLLQANKLGYFISWVVVAGLTAMLYLAIMLAYYTLILCCLIPFLLAPISFYLLLVGSALFGQTYRESLAMRPAA